MKAHQQLPLGFALLPEGFRYHEEVISPERERELIDQISGLPFRQFQFRGYTGLRQTVSFGWRYDFDDFRLSPAPPIPDFLLQLWEQVRSTAEFPMDDIQQALVTSYAPGTPIGWHRDRPVFGQVAGLSLGSACKFRLRRKEEERWKRISLDLEPRSAYLLDGPARWEWEHSIPPVEQQRYSITFRNLRGG